jgi:pimeloyl-ACP methyl ester carboxylesterase
MTTGIAKANGIDIAYETFGNPNARPLLAVMGLGAQMIAWDDEFMEKLAANDFHVIRFDNRDTGLSTKMENAPAPNVQAAMTGDTSSASYTLNDMADDAVGLMDTLGVSRAHIMGASMGGMIVQAMAIRHPRRIVSMTSIMSTTGARDVGQAKPEAMAVLLAPPAKSRDEAIEMSVTSSKVIGATGFPFDEARVRSIAARSYDRSNYPVGMARQLVGIVASGDRTEALKQVRVPTVVIHGDVDPLVTLSGGQATAAAIPGAKLVTIPGMGHDLPEGAWDTIVNAVVENAARAAAPVQA